VYTTLSFYLFLYFRILSVFSRSKKWFDEVCPLQNREALVKHVLEPEARFDWDVYHEDLTKNLMPIERFLNMERYHKLCVEFVHIYGGVSSLRIN
jgi:hypothetical protein